MVARRTRRRHTRVAGAHPEQQNNRGNVLVRATVARVQMVSGTTAENASGAGVRPRVARIQQVGSRRRGAGKERSSITTTTQ